MSVITIKNLSRKFPNRQVLKDLSFEIHDGEFTVITGLKESGKTTFIRTLCGLDAVESGEIYVDGVLINKLEPKDRNMALITDTVPLNQNASVFDNMAMGMKLRKYPKEEIESKVNKACEILGLTEYVRRLVKNLTPGLKYRVLLARAIAREPNIIVVDDILKGVEAGLKKELRAEMLKLNRRLGINFVYATSDSIDALTLADKIAFLEGGVLTQYGTTEELYDHPSTLPIATFFGQPKINLFVGNFTEEGNVYYFEAEGWKIKLNNLSDEQKVKKYLAKNKPVTLAVRAEDFIMDENGEFSAVVSDCDEYAGGKQISILYSDLTDNGVYFNVSLKLEPEEKVRLSVPTNRLLIYDTETEDLINKN